MSRVLKSSAVITQKFKGIGKHNGVDLVGEGHTTCPVIAHSAGTVEMAVTGHRNDPNATGDATYGNFVKIKHSNGYATLYAHLDRVFVSKGQTVDAGQEIGFMGSTGRSSGAHLHFEVRKNGTYNSIMDPEPFLNADLPGLSTGDRDYKIVLDWQKCMNRVYNCGLAEDNNYGPDSQAKANQYQLYYRSGNVIKNDMVRWVQQRLKNLGYNITVDRSYGPSTDNIVRQFQASRGLKADGYVGIDTYRELLKD